MDLKTQQLQIEAKANLTKLADVNPWQTLAIIQKYRIANLESGKTPSKRNILKALDNLSEDYALLNQANNSAYYYVSKFIKAGAEVENFFRTFAATYRQLRDYTMYLNDLENQYYDKRELLNNTPTDTFVFDKETALYAKLQEEVLAIKTAIKTLRNTLPESALSLGDLYTDPSTYNFNEKQKEKQIAKLTREILYMINIEAPTVDINLKISELNSAIDNTAEPSKYKKMTAL